MIVYYARSSGTMKATDGRTQNLLWGDWLDVSDDPADAKNYLVNWSYWNRDTDAVFAKQFGIAKKHCQAEPLLEMIFIDVGQGDGCIVSVPDGNGHKTMIVDAGDGDNMYRFLRWRTQGFRRGTAFDSAIITHPDKDHYQGFAPIFDRTEIGFKSVYHNGLVERQTTDKEDILGDRANGYCTDVRVTAADAHALLSDPANRGGKLYPNLMWTALTRFGDVQMLSTLAGEQVDGRAYVPGFAPEGSDTAIEILGPVPEPDNAGNLRMRIFGVPPGTEFIPGKTKNGHSVILRLQYRGFSAIFGGDLNKPAEDYLLRHYGGIGPDQPLRNAISEARKRWSADLLKCCHHGSADVTDEFVETVRPFAFVVSSGDQNSHVHPRPEILGLLGKKGRGERPLILSTELQRSSPESMTLSSDEMKALKTLMDAFDVATGAATKKAAREAVAAFWEKRMRRLITVYGAINVRTNGSKLVVAFKKEVSGGGWQIFEYNLVNGDWVGAERPSH